MSSKRRTHRKKDRDQSEDNYVWGPWGYNDKGEYCRYRLENGKYIYEYGYPSEASETTPRGGNEGGSGLASFDNSSPATSQESDGSTGENYLLSSQTSQPISHLPEQFRSLSLNDSTASTQDLYRDDSPPLVSGMGMGTSGPIEMTSNPWRPSPTAIAFSPSSRGGGWVATAEDYSSGMHSAYPQHTSSQGHSLSRQQYDSESDSAETLMSSSVVTVVPWLDQARQGATSSPLNSMVSSTWRNAPTPPPVALSYDPPQRAAGVSQQMAPSAAGSEVPRTAAEASGHDKITPKVQKDEVHKNIAGTKGSKERLDPEYKVQHSSLFKPAHVFKVLWSEPQGETSRSGTDITEEEILLKDGKYEEAIYQSIRRFVIVAADKGHCQCVPILTYGNQGTLKPGVKPEDHAIVYTDRPRPFQGEKLDLQPIRMKPISPRDKLDRASRINYAKVYTVEHNVKVLFIGKIEKSSLRTFVTDFDVVWCRKRHPSSFESA